MASTPAQLNAMSDGDLRSFASDVLNHLRDPTQIPMPAPCARFVTADILLRLHKFIVDFRQTRDCGGWSKQATVAKVVAGFTGVALQRSDAEYIGNAQDTFLRDYRIALAKAMAAERRSRKRTLQAGRAVNEEAIGARVLELKQQIFKCKFGGVPRNIVVPRVAGVAVSVPILKQPIPVRKVEHADEVNLKLQQRVIQLQEEKLQERDMHLNLHALCNAIDKVQRAREVAEQQAEEMARAQEEAASKAASEVQRLKKHIQEAERETNNAKGQVIRLQSQLGAAHLDVARAMEREQNIRFDAEEAGRKAASERTEAAAKADTDMQKMKQRIHEALKETAKANGQVHRLQSQLGAAHVDAARAAERELKVRDDAAVAARQAACAQVEVVATVTTRLLQARAEARRAERETKDARGMMERLGAQLGMTACVSLCHVYSS